MRRLAVRRPGRRARRRASAGYGRGGRRRGPGTRRWLRHPVLEWSVALLGDPVGQHRQPDRARGRRRSGRASARASRTQPRRTPTRGHGVRARLAPWAAETPAPVAGDRAGHPRGWPPPRPRPAAPHALRLRRSRPGGQRRANSEGFEDAGAETAARSAAPGRPSHSKDPATTGTSPRHGDERQPAELQAGEPEGTRRPPPPAPAHDRGPAWSGTHGGTVSRARPGEGRARANPVRAQHPELARPARTCPPEHPSRTLPDRAEPGRAESGRPDRVARSGALPATHPRASDGGAVVEPHAPASLVQLASVRLAARRVRTGIEAIVGSGDRSGSRPRPRRPLRPRRAGEARQPGASLAWLHAAHSPSPVGLALVGPPRPRP